MLNNIGLLLIYLFLGLNSESYHTRKNCSKILQYQPYVVLCIFKNSNPTIEQDDHIDLAISKRFVFFSDKRKVVSDFNDRLNVIMWQSRFRFYDQKMAHEQRLKDQETEKKDEK